MQNESQITNTEYQRTRGNHDGMTLVLWRSVFDRSPGFL
jgi:hypothetical protein